METLTGHQHCYAWAVADLYFISYHKLKEVCTHIVFVLIAAAREGIPSLGPKFAVSGL